MDPIFESSYLGFKTSVYKNRVEFKSLGIETKIIPIDKIASITLPMWGVMKITLVAVSGERIDIPTRKKKELRDAVYKAQENTQ